MREIDEFCCPTFIPAGQDENDFCIPDDCFEKNNRQPKFPSPTSCLPMPDLMELEENIAETNQFLLDLALDERYSNRQVWQRIFTGLIGQKVVVIMDAEIANEVCGKVKLAGFDFVLIEDKEEKLLVPYACILRTVTECGSKEHMHEPALLDIDPCFRRDLTFCFGDTVAASPHLIQLFFGIPLAVYLLKEIGQEAVILVKGRRVVGIICHLTKQSISIDHGGKEITVPFEQIVAMYVK